MSVLDDMRNDYLQRCLQKLASAAKVSFTAQALLEDCNQFLSKINNEAKVRPSTKSLVLGIAKVMATRDLDW
jgi:hypothetical protein